MDKGDVLWRGDWLASENEEFLLLMRANGNLQLFHKTIDSILWLSGTSDRGHRLEMSTNGDLVLFDRRNETLWHSDTKDLGEYLVLKDDGDLVVNDLNGFKVWSSETKLN